MGMNQDFYPFSDEQPNVYQTNMQNDGPVFQNIGDAYVASQTGYGQQSFEDQPNYTDGYEALYDGYDGGEETYEPIAVETSDIGHQEDPRRSEESVNETDVIGLLNQAEQLLINARSMPFSSHALVDREALINLIAMARDYLPEEVRRARWLIEQNQQVIEESQRMAESIIRQAERRGASMIDEHEITLQARQRATQTVEFANESARQIREGALEYADRRLTVLEEQLTTMLVTIQKNKKELR